MRQSVPGGEIDKEDSIGLVVGEGRLEGRNGGMADTLFKEPVFEIEALVPVPLALEGGVFVFHFRNA